MGRHGAMDRPWRFAHARLVACRPAFRCDTDRVVVWFSYHGGHSGEFCRHAKGELSEVVAAAFAAGFTTYGLSEHCPRGQPEFLYPEEADLGVEGLSRQFEDYVKEARSLQREYAGRMEVLVGFETEVLPPNGWASAMRSLRREHGFDYIVGSVHSVGDRWIDFSPEMTRKAAEECGGWDALCVAYFDQLADLIQTLEPEVVGHVDLVRKFEGHDIEFPPAVMRRVDRVLESARSVGAALEVNAAPVRRGFGPVYPCPQILRRARQMEVPVTLGDDSHGPEEVGKRLDASRNAIAAAGYWNVHYLTRREGRVAYETVAVSEVKPRSVGLS